MREYKKNICVSDSNRLTEKAFNQNITISIIGILLCMAALCSVTWAWFSTEISSSPSDISSAYCDVTVSVMNGDTDIEPLEEKYAFAKDTAYKITISAEGNAKTAYCILNVDGTNYYTAQIPIGESIAFTVQFNNAETTEVEIIKCWGTSSIPDEDRTFKNGGLYLNCDPKAELPKAIVETNSTTEAIESQPINNGTPVEGTTASEVVTESDTAEAAEVVTDISPSETTQ